MPKSFVVVYEVSSSAVRSLHTSTSPEGLLGAPAPRGDVTLGLRLGGLPSSL